MHLLVASEPDIASMSIRETLLSIAKWEALPERFEGNSVYKYRDLLLITVNKLHIYAENLDRDVKAAGFDFDKIIVLSRHRSETEIPTLTVHPVGNFGRAEFGGRDFDFAPAAPELMGSALRKLVKLGGKMDYKISLEVTHHGPFVETPIMFIEIGSNETRWKDPVAAEVIAKTVLELEGTEYPVVVGIGGGHYAPRYTEMATGKKLNFAHMVPEYAVPVLTTDTLEKVVSKPKPDYIYIHEKGLKKENLRRLEELLESFTIPRCSSNDFEPFVVS
ncbi:MAG: D-aminoacyl-tRNA deacylase [Thermoplasmata archaeon]|nr:D-aminoacyl-tRNA deacylase [Thermoplasmata archaeon]